jgi:hypothetical protein
LRLGLLDTNDIRVLLVHPFKKTLAGGRPDAVGVQSDNPHPWLCSGKGLQRASIAKRHGQMARIFYSCPIFWHTGRSLERILW